MAKFKIVPVLNLGLPDQFIPHGNQQEVRIEYQLDATGIYKKIMKWMNNKAFIFKENLSSPIIIKGQG